MHKYLTEHKFCRSFIRVTVVRFLHAMHLQHRALPSTQRVHLCQSDTHNHRTHLKLTLRWSFDSDNARTSVIAFTTTCMRKLCETNEASGFFTLILSDCQAELQMNFMHCTFLSYLLQPKLFFFRMRCSVHNRPALVINSF